MLNIEGNKKSFGVLAILDNTEANRIMNLKYSYFKRELLRNFLVKN